MLDKPAKLFLLGQKVQQTQLSNVYSFIFYGIIKHKIILVWFPDCWLIFYLSFVWQDSLKEYYFQTHIYKFIKEETSQVFAYFT